MCYAFSREGKSIVFFSDEHLRLSVVVKILSSGLSMRICTRCHCRLFHRLDFFALSDIRDLRYGNLISLI